MILKKECTVMFPTLASIVTHRKRLDLVKTHMRLKLPLQRITCAQSTLPVHFSNIKQSHAEFNLTILTFFSARLFVYCTNSLEKYVKTSCLPACDNPVCG